MLSSILRLAIAAATLTSLAVAEGPSCQHKSDITKQPSGNPIATPGSTSEVPVGVPYDIAWQNTTTGAVSLVLLRGPSTNAVDFLCIVDSIPNSGRYSWTPPTSLENDVSHYGIKIVVDATGDYQYSTQFGIVNDGSKSQSSSSSTTPAQSQQQGGGGQQTSTTTINMVSTHVVYQTSIISIPCSSHECNKASTTAITNTPTTTASRFSATTTTPSTQPLTSKTTLSFTGTGPARANSTTFRFSSTGGGSVGTTPSLRLPTVLPGTASTGYGNRTAEPSPTKPITKPASLGPTSGAAAPNTQTSLSIQTPASPAVPTTPTRPPPAAQTGNAAARGMGRAVGAVLVAVVGMGVVVVV
ncbi:MAG: hypothetical protein OHK93_001284 [Ramalina farinacea]|uniref:Yeast cell wall synthesis Kre9/Knh1-like N-terminal domain-containing protein n=1 Tax=Ramalina farinacea TaxID=258253 RepID=A0AA43QR91_9LECA|nr:hypothetical protein [Ramalina farinacea]